MSLVIDAAIAGQGVALARSALVERDLNEGRLIRPLTQQTAAEFAYWIVCLPQAADVPKSSRFREWLLAAAQRAA